MLAIRTHLKYRFLLALLPAVLLGVSQSSTAGELQTGLSKEQQALHLLNRIAFGPRPGDLDHVVAIGPERYIDEQLNPSSIPLPDDLVKRVDGLLTATESGGEVLAEFVAVRKAARNDGEAAKEKQRELFRQITEETAEARLVRAIYSPRQLEEVMVDFWFNHFNVFIGKNLDRALLASYERDAIRPYVLGHFRDMLGATAKHPAMLFYLDNWLSVRNGYEPRARFGKAVKQPANNKSTGLNENYARELMELHTLGVDGGYTQKDVTELARMLTGWTFDPRDMIKSGASFRFDSARHDNDDKLWLGHAVSANGQHEGEWALDVLAQHPATAHHLSYELAQYFVSDTPPKALVDRLAQRYLATKGDIREVMRTLLESREFWDAAKTSPKFKTPYQYLVSAARASDVPVNNIRPVLGMLNQLGMPLYGCVTPDGYKNTEAAWLNPDALTRRINFATAFATGRLPLSKTVSDGGDEMSKKSLDKAANGEGNKLRATPLEVNALLATLGPAISSDTRNTISQSEPALRAALVLGSPDFMRH